MTLARPSRHRLKIGFVSVLVIFIGITSTFATPCASAQLVINNLSIHSTMPDTSGMQLVTTSFQIINNGTTTVAPSTTTVQVAGNTTSLVTPRLLPGGSAFFGISTSTNLTDFMVVINAANNTTTSYHFLVGQTGRWRPIGPSVIMYKGLPEGVGMINTIALDASTTGTVYVGSYATGLWKTVDAGAHWEPLTDALPSLQIYAVAVDSGNTQHVLIDTPAGVFSSTNGGHVWIMINSTDLQGRGYDGGTFIVEGLRPVICCATASLVASRVGYNAAGDRTIPNASIFAPLNLVFAYLTTLNGLSVSLDGGTTWSQVLGGGVAIMDQDRFNPAHILAAITGATAGSGNSAVYETFFGGLATGLWHQLQGCPGAQLPALPDGPRTAVWVAQSAGTQWISIKNGAQHEIWSTTGQTCVVNGSPEHGWQRIFSGNPCGGDQSISSYFHADPRNAQILYKAGVHLCRSTDGGASFQLVPDTHADHHALVFHPLFPSLLYDGNDGGFYQSLDGGQTFSFDSVGISATEFLDGDVGGAFPRYVLGSSQDNGISATDMSSPAWQMVDIRGDGDRTTAAVDPLDNTVQYSEGQAIDHLTIVHNGVPASLDASGLPTGCVTYDTSPFLYSQFLATSNPNWHLLIASGSNCSGGLWTGPPWNPLFSPSDGEKLVRVTYDSSIGLFLAGGNAGSVYINFSPDFMAKVWQSPSLGLVTAIIPDPAAPANYFVSLGNALPTGEIFEIHSTGPLHFDGTDITANLPAVVVMTLVTNPNEPGVLYAGTKGKGVFRGVKDNSGNWTWQAFNNGMPAGTNVTKLRYDPQSGTIFASTFGRGEFALSTVVIF